MNSRIDSGGLGLAAYLARPPARGQGPSSTPGLVLCHGFPVGPLGARQSAGTFPELADRIATEMGWAALTFAFRGCGDSEGDFSLGGWLADLRAGVEHLRSEVDLSGVWLAGISTGGSLGLCLAAEDATIRGVAALAARADFDDWANQPRRFLEHARDMGAVRDPKFPPAFDVWSRELRTLRPLEAARRLAPRPLLVVHGDDDEVVPTMEARLIADAHGSAELRVLPGAGHRLRHDPRAVAMLLGWLDRQRNRAMVG